MLTVRSRNPALVLELVLLLSKIFETPRAIRQQQIHDHLLVIVLRDVHGRLLLLVLVVHICPAILDQELS